MSTDKLAFLFPGQGAQYIGMGKDFFDAYPVARQTFEEAEDLLKVKVQKTIFNGPESTLTETHNSQLAIYIVSMSILRVIQQLYPQLEPSICAGLSLGEYTAITAAGIISFQEALPIVQHRGIFMSEACEETVGTMAVVLGLESSEVERLVENLNMPHDIWAANFNSPGQVVVSGTKKGVDAATKAAKDAGAKRVVPLQVHGAFHSGLMQSAEKKMAPYIDALNFQKSKTAIVMNVTGNVVVDHKEMKKNLLHQLTHPVRWEQGIREIQKEGASLYIEIGCGKTLSGMNKRIGVLAPTISVEKIDELKKLETSEAKV